MCEKKRSTGFMLLDKDSLLEFSNIKRCILFIKKPQIIKNLTLVSIVLLQSQQHAKMHYK